MNTARQAHLSRLGGVFVLLAFALSLRQAPLYTSNQNTYFLHGLASTGRGFLDLDWLSRTADPAPVFTWLVRVTSAFDERLFHLIYIALLMIFAASVLGIASRTLGIGVSRVRFLAAAALLAFWYSGLLAGLLAMLPLARRVAFLFNPAGHLTSGVAGQYVLGPFLQPSVFGIFLVLSIYLFLRDLQIAAIACLAVAATFHPAYLLSAGVLAVTYMAVVFADERDYRRPLLLGVVGLVLVTPILAYTLTSFRPTSPEIFAEAQRILVDYRMPHHAKPAAWFGPSALLKVGVILLGLFLVRKTRLFRVSSLVLLVTVTLTLVQLSTGSRGLALLFPWRLTVILVPLFSFLILARAVAAAAQLIVPRAPGLVAPARAALVVLMAGIGCLGFVRTITLMSSPRHGVSPSTRFVAASAQPGDLYLIPPELGWFRLATGVPILADRKSHPYRDVEVVEWFDRVERATNYYSDTSEASCSLLASLVVDYGVSHVYARSDRQIADCGLLLEIFRDSAFAVFRVETSQPRRASHAT